MIQLLFFILVTLSYADVDYTCGPNCRWIYVDQTLTIEGTGEIKNYDSFHYEYPPWNDHREDITKIIIGEGITVIGTSAFYGCNNVTSITIPSTVTTFKSYSFAFCMALPTLEIPQSVVSIEEYAFRGCTHLKTLKYNGFSQPNNCTATTFYDCHVLTSIVIPSQYASNSASFCGFTNLVTEITDQSGTCGTKCKWSFDIETENLKITGEDEIGDFPNGRSPWFLLRSNISTVDITKGLTFIGNYSFYNLTKLENVTIGKDVDEIAETAFENCIRLTKVVVNSNEMPTCSNSTFASSPFLLNVSVPHNYDEDHFCGETVIERSAESSSNVGLIVGLTTASAVILILIIVCVVLVVFFVFRAKSKKSTYTDL